MPRIVTVEDDESIRTELKAMLERNGYEVVAPTSFEDVPAQVLAADPDLVLLDLNLPMVDGTVVCREVRSRSAVPIIVVTSRVGEIDEVMCMNMGADDFVAKPYSTHVLLARIEALLRRASGDLTGQVIEHKGLSVDLARSCAEANGRTVELTKNELRILAFLMRHAGTIVSRETIMCELWNSDAFIDDNTLTVNVNRLRSTLASIGVEDYLVTHRGQGYSV
ncbi:MAG: response regulator transcription factor [Atopobiaceae bacterium]|nr:response regulator transcription factor [Atopobiaceae bacterium]MCH4180805.1 response regulator transcription factor [Atopobiaceae bacterium]MCH4214152.1 response regulator transcription factor [Atopobiaceae bacterium]MCH4229674.1 response regulator transcription factor [Atopobiaceae bacterium]MCH4276504.1 response regulator transcription factor [Atopobiaceae bacterium]